MVKKVSIYSTLEQCKKTIIIQQRCNPRIKMKRVYDVYFVDIYDSSQNLSSP